MSFWIYKCNTRQPEHASTRGDWDEVFDAGLPTRWGSVDLKGVDQIEVGDQLIAHQSDRSKLVGLADVVAFEEHDETRYIRIQPRERIGVKIPPLKKADPKIAAIKALQGGYIATAYDISAADARRLLAAARKAAKQDRKQFRRKASTALNNDLDDIDELPEQDRQTVLRETRRVLRSAILRPRVTAVWGARCAACGLELDDLNGGTECEVAHIHDVFEGGKDLVANAIPLCRTHHWAFDRHLWAIHPSTRTIHVRKSHRKALASIKGVKVERPAVDGDVEPLAKKHLEWRWKKYQSVKE